MAGRKLQCADCSKQSLMAVLNTFVDAVNTMDERVMIPSRLRDMDIADSPALECLEENNNLSVLPASSNRGEDMYSYYVMINAIKRELQSGKGPTSAPGGSDAEMDNSSEDSDDGTNNAARKTAEAFRHHLQGIFGLLHQMTHTAKYLGDAYEEQIGTGKKLRKFVI